MFQNNLKFNDPKYYNDKEKYFYKEFDVPTVQDIDITADKPLQKFVMWHKLEGEYRGTFFCQTYLMDVYNNEIVFY